MTKITTLKNGDVLVAQAYFGGEDNATMTRTFQAVGCYVHQVHRNGSTSQVCEGLRPTGPTLMCGDDLAESIRRTLAE